MNYLLLQGDVLVRLRELQSESVHCVVTSPPYWGLRDYGVAGQIGLEATPEEYVGKLVDVFREVRRVLRRDGTLWLNLGDTYARYWGDANARRQGRRSRADTNGWTNGFHMNAVEAFPEAHFAVFPAKLVEPCILAGISEHGCCEECGASWQRIVKREVAFQSGSGRAGHEPHGKHAGAEQSESGDYDIRFGPVITTSTVGWEPSCSCPAPAAPCTVLDPFNGAGTTGLVALRLGRRYVGSELNPDYIAISERRIREDAPLFRQEGSHELYRTTDGQRRSSSSSDH